ncbi:hypothetical protein F2S88_21335 [Pseudomonas syringae pv. actinidiae]|nr:hypothetical protein [Pseudomonas syringae pv. actinidiae]
MNIYSALTIYLYLDADRSTGQAGAHLKIKNHRISFLPMAFESEARGSALRLAGTIEVCL